MLDRRLDAREPGLPAEQRLGIAERPSLLDRLVDVDADAGEALIIAADHVLRLVCADLQPPRQAPARNAVEDGEVDRLGASARVAIDLAEQLLGRGGVNVLAIGEGVAQRRHIGHMRRQPQLDLAIVGRQDDIAGLGDEGVADLPPDFGADRDILQIGIGGGQAAGLRPGQRIAGMDPAAILVDLRLQRVGIGGFELRQLPPFQHLGGDRRALRLELFKDRDVGRIGAGLALLAALVTHLVEQDPAQLLGRSDREGLPRNLVDFRLQRRDAGGEFGRQARQRLAIHLDAAMLHARDHPDQRPVDQFVDAVGALIGDAGLEPLPQAQRHVRILGSIFGCAVERHFGKADLVLAGADHLLEADAFMAQMLARRLVHAMA